MSGELVMILAEWLRPASESGQQHSTSSPEQALTTTSCQSLILHAGRSALLPGGCDSLFETSRRPE